MSAQELKALAYDMMAQISNLQNQVGALNQLIAEKSKEDAKQDLKPLEGVVESSTSL